MKIVNDIWFSSSLIITTIIIPSTIHDFTTISTQEIMITTLILKHQNTLNTISTPVDSGLLITNKSHYVLLKTRIRMVKSNEYIDSNRTLFVIIK